LDALPVSSTLSDWILVLEIPAGTPLGENEHDFSYVLTRSYDRMKGCWMDPVPPIAFFSTGKLGALKGGLLNLQDAREVLNKDAIVEMAKSTVDEKLEKKRTLWVGSL